MKDLLDERIPTPSHPLSAVAGLYKDQIAKQAREIAANLHGPQKQLSFADDPLIELDSILGAADQIYRESIAPQNPSFRQEDFALAISEMFQQDLMDDDMLVAQDEQGDGYKINKHLMRSIKTKGDLANRRNAFKYVAKKIQNKHKQTLSAMTLGLEASFGTKPEKYRIRTFSRVQEKKFLSRMDEYKTAEISRTQMSERDRVMKYWMRAVGIYLVREQVRFKSLYDYTQFMSLLAHHREIPDSSYQYVKQLIIERKNLLYKTAFPLKYQKLAPDELASQINHLNMKYGVMDEYGTPFCLWAYYLVRKIMATGQDYQDLYAEILERKKQQYGFGTHVASEPTSQTTRTQLSFHDMAIQFPPPSEPREGSKVDFVSAVKQVLAYHPNRLEQNILWQIFHKYNYYFRMSRKYQGKQLSQVMNVYNQKKQLEHDQLHGKISLKPVIDDLYTSVLYAPDELIDLHVARIKPM